MRLPKDVKLILDLLEEKGYEAYAVGGCVRDTLLGKKPVYANVISTEDLADFIVLHMTDENKMYGIGGKETYSYEEIANLCFEAAGKTPVIKRAPAFLFDVLAWANKIQSF